MASHEAGPGRGPSQRQAAGKCDGGEGAYWAMLSRARSLSAEGLLFDNQTWESASRVRCRHHAAYGHDIPGSPLSARVGQSSGMVYMSLCAPGLSLNYPRFLG